MNIKFKSTFIKSESIQIDIQNHILVGSFFAIDLKVENIKWLNTFFVDLFIEINQHKTVQRLTIRRANQGNTDTDKLKIKFLNNNHRKDTNLTKTRI